jgi:hypothetical protein
MQEQARTRQAYRDLDAHVITKAVPVLLMFMAEPGRLPEAGPARCSGRVAIMQPPWMPASRDPIAVRRHERSRKIPGAVPVR